MKFLIKLSGTLLEEKETRRRLAAEIAAVVGAGHETVVVHGGGKRLSRYLSTHGIESEFRHGFRVTPPDMLDAVLRIFAGEINHHLVAELNNAGTRAVGLSGIDAGLVRAVPLSDDLGAVGEVDQVDASILNLLASQGYLPTVACVAGGRKDDIYNINADQMAVACAGGFAADELIFLTDVDGVLDQNGTLVPELTAGQAENLITSGVAHGGMEAKLRAAMAGLAQGIGRVRIVAGARQGVLTRVTRGESMGTTLTSE